MMISPIDIEVTVAYKGGTRIFIGVVAYKQCPHTHYEKGTEFTFARSPGPA